MKQTLKSRTDGTQKQPQHNAHAFPQLRGRAAWLGILLYNGVITVNEQKSEQKLVRGNLWDSIKSFSIKSDNTDIKMDTDFKSTRLKTAKAATYHLGLRGKREKEVA